MSLLVRQSGIECTAAVIPLDTDEGTAKIAAASPCRPVPVLHCDGQLVWDSLGIAEFLIERIRSIWRQCRDGYGSAVRSCSAPGRRPMRCSKFRERFGLDAARFVNSEAGKALQMRGINAMVVAPGEVRVGHAVRKLSRAR